MLKRLAQINWALAAQAYLHSLAFVCLSLALIVGVFLLATSTDHAPLFSPGTPVALLLLALLSWRTVRGKRWQWLALPLAAFWLLLQEHIAVLHAATGLLLALMLWGFNALLQRRESLQPLSFALGSITVISALLLLILPINYQPLFEQSFSLTQHLFGVTLLLLSGIGLLAQTSQDDDSETLPWPAISLIVAVIGSLLWFAQIQYSQQLEHLRGQQQLERIEQILTRELHANERLVETHATLWASRAVADQAQWNKSGEALSTILPDLAAGFILNHYGAQQFNYYPPGTDTESLINLLPMNDLPRWLRQLRQSPSIGFSHSVNGSQGWVHGIGRYLPQSQQYMVLIIKLPSWLSTQLTDISQRTPLRLYEGRYELFASLRSEDIIEPAQPLTLPGQLNWQVKLLTSSAKDIQAITTELILLFTTLVGALLGLVMHLMQQSSQRTQRLQQQQLALANSLMESEQLRQTNQQMMEQSLDVLCALDENRLIRWISPAIERLCARQTANLAGLNFHELVWAEDRHSFNQAVQTVSQGLPLYDLRLRLTHADGHVVPTLWSLRWSRQESSYYLVGRDIQTLQATENFQTQQREILSEISNDKPAQHILHMLIDLIIDYVPGTSVAFHKVDGQDALIAIAHSHRAQPVLDELGLTGPGELCDAPLEATLQRCRSHNSRQASIQWQQRLGQHGLRDSLCLPLINARHDVLGIMTLVVENTAALEAPYAERWTLAANLATITLERDRQKHQLQMNEQYYRSLFDNHPDAVFSCDLQGRLLAANQATSALIKIPRERLPGHRLEEFLLAEDVSLMQAQYERVIAGQPQHRELEWLDSEKHVWHVDVTQLPIHVDGDCAGVFNIVRNITLAKSAEQHLKLSQRALEACSNGIVISDARLPDQPVVYVNAAFTRITGYSVEDILGRNCSVLQQDVPHSKAVEQLNAAIKAGESVHVVMQNRRKNGELFWNDLQIEPVFDDKNMLTHFVGIQTDVTSQKHYEKELAFHASHDRLTALPNRALLEDRLSQAVHAAQRRQRLLALLFIDLDEFKPINDTFGHAVGDEVLMEIAERLRCEVRNEDTLARMGGDEYVILLPELDNEQQAVQVAERIIASIDRPIVHQDLTLHVTCSVGISFTYDGELEQPTQLLQQADMAMYRAKQNGRNTYDIYTEDLDESVSARMVLRNELRRALARDEFILHFQPQVDGRTGRISGIEALIRWRHPELGMVPPNDFIPLAESSGQIVPIGAWALREACRVNKLLLDRGLCDCPMAVNLSPAQLRRQPFAQLVEQTLQETGLPANRLELEITESILMQDTENSVAVLKALSQQGVRTAIDDFGTGFSSLSYLKILPLNKVKIDRAFVSDIIRNSHDAAITQAIIAMAHHLSMGVIAEGVEEEGQFNFLLKSQCDEFQGFFFSKPLPEDQLVAFLQQNRQGVTLPEQAQEQVQTLLLVDDEPNILRALTRLLRRDGYTILTANSAQEGFELLARNNVQVIISDQRMPGMSGTEFLRKVKDIHPHTVRMVLSGYTDLASVTEAINQGSIYKYLVKPWEDEQLREVIRQAFQQYELQLRTTMRLNA
ncbi:EAL domain-containing protein [Atopomonas hussainii]|uniref:EAL domain-containing protein n=1 Tax=Atopomonas hussainii TaxID=1429083 RepID=UPI00090027B8|nr:EAL domain-containing protein [Atopomonas hussainii]